MSSRPIETATANAANTSGADRNTSGPGTNVAATTRAVSGDRRHGFALINAAIPIRVAARDENDVVGQLSAMAGGDVTVYSTPGDVPQQLYISGGKPCR